jgi:hypothetical protein
MGIQYMVTGSIASSLYGEPRLSHAIDVILHGTAENAIRLAGAFPPPCFYLDPSEAIAEMVREESMFGDKVDFWIVTSSPYDRERFRRRVCVDAFGAAVWVSSSEDIILSKLSWSMRAGGSE